MADQYIGETYEDEDTRSEGRRIKIISKLDGDNDRYRTKVVTNIGNPASVGRAGTISVRTLNAKYRKTSH